MPIAGLFDFAIGLRQHGRISDLRSQISDLRFQISDFRSQISDLRSQISDLRSQISDFRFQISDCRSQILSLQYKALSIPHPGGVPEMKYTRFEDLPVWKDAIQFAAQVYHLTRRSEFRGRYSLRDQIERAAVSISNNIAEGFERGTTQETLTFLYISRGSSGEVRSMLWLLESLSGFNDLRSEISDLKSKALSISRQLRAWADSLQNSEIRGQRYLTNKGKRATREAREREEFLEELRQMQEHAKVPSQEETT